MSEYESLISKYGSDRKAAAALGISRSAFNNKYRKEAGLCVIVGCKRPPKPGKGRCVECLAKAKNHLTKEQVQEKNKAYYWANREKLAKYNKEYQKNNLARFRKSRAKWDSTEAGRISA